MAEGNQADIQVLKGLDAFEFYPRLIVWENAIEAKIERLNQMQNT